MSERRAKGLRVARGAAWLAAGLLIAGATAPRARLLLVEGSIFSDDECLAPSGAGCDYAPSLSARDPQPSASAALLEPGSHSDPGERALLRAELPGLIDFGPEVAGGSRPSERGLRIVGHELPRSR